MLFVRPKTVGKVKSQSVVRACSDVISAVRTYPYVAAFHVGCQQIRGKPLFYLNIVNENRRNNRLIVILLIALGCQTNLVEIVGAVRLPRLLAGVDQDREQQRDQDGDD